MVYRILHNGTLPVPLNTPVLKKNHFKTSTSTSLATIYPLVFEDGSTVTLGNSSTYTNWTIKDWMSITDANLTVFMVYDKLFHSAKFLEFMAFESKKAGDPLDYRYTYLNNSDAVQFNYRQFFFYALLDDHSFPKDPANDVIASILLDNNVLLSPKVAYICMHLMVAFLKRKFQYSCNILADTSLPRGRGCRPYWDGTACWPPAKLGEVLVRYCPPYVPNFHLNQTVTMQCHLNGSWDREANYTPCYFPAKHPARIRFESTSDLISTTLAKLDNQTTEDLNYFNKLFEHSPFLKRLATVGNSISAFVLALFICLFADKRMRSPSFKNQIHFHTFLAFFGRSVFYLINLHVFESEVMDVASYAAMLDPVIDLLQVWKNFYNFNDSTPFAPSMLLDVVEVSGYNKSEAFAGALQDVVYRLPTPPIPVRIPFSPLLCSVSNLTWSYFTLATYVWISLESVALMHYLTTKTHSHMRLKQVTQIGWSWPYYIIFARLLLHLYFSNNKKLSCCAIGELNLTWVALLHDFPIFLNVWFAVVCYIIITFTLATSSIIHQQYRCLATCLHIRVWSLFVLGLVLGFYQIFMILFKFHGTYLTVIDLYTTFVCEYISVTIQSFQGAGVAVLFGYSSNAVVIDHPHPPDAPLICQKCVRNLFRPVAELVSIRANIWRPYGLAVNGFDSIGKTDRFAFHIALNKNIRKSPFIALFTQSSRRDAPIAMGVLKAKKDSKSGSVLPEDTDVTVDAYRWTRNHLCNRCSAKMVMSSL